MPCIGPTLRRFFPVIEPILAKNGLPDDFKYLAVAESDLQNATSHAGAKGIWQFMYAMAQHYDLEVNREVESDAHDLVLFGASQKRHILHKLVQFIDCSMLIVKNPCGKIPLGRR